MLHSEDGEMHHKMLHSEDGEMPPFMMPLKDSGMPLDMEERIINPEFDEIFQGAIDRLSESEIFSPFSEDFKNASTLIQSLIMSSANYEKALENYSIIEVSLAAAKDVMSFSKDDNEILGNFNYVLQSSSREEANNRLQEILRDLSDQEPVKEEQSQNFTGDVIEETVECSLDECIESLKNLNFTDLENMDPSHKEFLMKFIVN